MSTTANIFIAALLALIPASAYAEGGHGESHGGASERGHGAPAEAVEDNSVQLAPAPPPLTPEEASKQPFGLVRTLQAVQDQVAQGNATAHEFQKRYLYQLGEELRQAPPTLWDEPRNARAAVVFTLSGGDPRLMKELLARAPLPPIDENLLKASLAFGENRRDDALRFLEPIDPQALDPGVAGLVALIHGTLLSRAEPRKAIAKFGQARLLSPGTLIEESALRQEILLVAREGMMDRFDKLFSQYARRFAKSVYAANFRRQFFAGVARQDFKGTSEWISRTEAEVKKLAAADRMSAYLSIAQEATVGGNVEIAGYAAKNAADLARPGSPDQERAKAYAGAALILTEDYETGVETLKSVSKDKLRKPDKDVLAAAVSLASVLRRMPEAPAESAEPLPVSVTKAQDLITNVDSLLDGGSP